MRDQLIQKIKAKDAVVGVIGLGYAGLPLSLCFTEKGFNSLGFDIDESKVSALKSGQSYIRHIPAGRIAKAIGSGVFEPTTQFSRLSDCDAILIAVPTPLNKNREPDKSFIVSTCETIAKNLRRGQLVVLESTTYPGTTEEVVVPILERSGLEVIRMFS